MIFSTKKKLLDITDTMPYGQYKGDKIYKVMADDPAYMQFFVKSSSDSFEYSEKITRVLINIRPKFKRKKK